LADTEDFPINPIFELNVNISTLDFSKNELDVAIKQMKVNKAPGLDSLPLELWNLPTFKEMLLSTCNDILNGNHLSAWGLSSGIVPVHKKSYFTKADNYRGRSLTQVAAKCYNRLLLNRLCLEIDKILEVEDTLPSTSQILTLHMT